ncbi:hypothetical protein V1283_004115 [Bradyrhizobium sp. AZCC 2262]|uniref:hypothetical protein n=1 Tax=Bradyrhizobium sp. AZCC 2262 TaxID=3117022 RepID=UPI002FEF9944
MNRSISSGADESVDRTVDHQGEQRISVAIEYAGDDLCHAFGNGIAEQIVQVLKGKAQQAQKRLASLAVARSDCWVVVSMALPPPGRNLDTHDGKNFWTAGGLP